MTFIIALTMALSLQVAPTASDSDARLQALSAEAENSTVDLFRFIGTCQTQLNITPDQLKAELDKKSRNNPEMKQRLMDAFRAGGEAPEAATLTQEACSQGMLTRLQAMMKSLSAMLTSVSESLASAD